MRPDWNMDAAAGVLLAAAFATDDGFNRPTLHCPFCVDGGEFTHLQGVEYRASEGEPVTVTFLHGEDDPHTAVRVEPGAQLSSCGPVRASSRRGSLMLVFDCECGGHRFGVTFEQHKGNEFLHVVELGRRDER